MIDRANYVPPTRCQDVNEAFKLAKRSLERLEYFLTTNSPRELIEREAMLLIYRAAEIYQAVFTAPMASLRPALATSYFSYIVLHFVRSIDLNIIVPRVAKSMAQTPMMAVETSQPKTTVKSPTSI